MGVGKEWERDRERERDSERGQRRRKGGMCMWFQTLDEMYVRGNFNALGLNKKLKEKKKEKKRIWKLIYIYAGNILFTHIPNQYKYAKVFVHITMDSNYQTQRTLYTYVRNM